MQFPNGVNKSNLIKLGLLGAAVYMMRNKGNTKPAITNENNSSDVADDKENNDASNNDTSKSTTAFQMGKELADKFLGKKM